MQCEKQWGEKLMSGATIVAVRLPYRSKVVPDSGFNPRQDRYSNDEFKFKFWVWLFLSSFVIHSTLTPTTQMRIQLQGYECKKCYYYTLVLKGSYDLWSTFNKTPVLYRSE